MTATDYTCARCGDDIAAGEPYVVIAIMWMRAEHVEAVARVHEDCTEGLTKAVRSAVSTR